MPRADSTLGLATSTASKLWPGRAILRYGLAICGGVTSIMTTKTAGIAHVTNVVRMCSPGYFHERKYVLAIEGHELVARRL